MIEAQRLEALRSCMSHAVAVGRQPDDLLSLIFTVVAASPDLADELANYLRTHDERASVATATIGLVLNFVAIQSDEMTNAIIEAVNAEIESSPTANGAEP